MIFLSAVNILLQAIAALLIFVVGYLGLLLALIAGGLLADLLYKGARLLWSHTAVHTASSNAVATRFAANPPMAPYNVLMIGHPPAALRKSSLQIPIKSLVS